MYVTYTYGDCKDFGQSELHKARRDRSCTKPKGIGSLMMLAHFHGYKHFRGKSILMFEIILHHGWTDQSNESMFLLYSS